MARKMPADVIIVVGLGQVGFRTAQLLAQIGEQVAVISLDVNPKFRASLLALGARVIDGDGRSLEVLLEAGLERAQAVIACTSVDLLNIEIALDVMRAVPHSRVVLRLADPSLAKQIEDHLDIKRAMAISNLSAPAFAASALGQAVLGTLSWNDERWVMTQLNDNDEREHTVLADQEGEKCNAMVRWPNWVREHQRLNQANSPVTLEQWTKPRNLRAFWRTWPTLYKAVGTTLIFFVFVSTLVTAFAWRIPPVEAFYFVVTTITTVGYGDHSAKGQPTWVVLYTCLMMLIGSATIAVVYSLITDALVSARFEAFQGQRPTDLSQHVIVVGLGELGFQVVKEFESMGLPVAVIDMVADARYRSQLGDETAFLVGDARDERTLLRANVANARAVIVTTDDDSVNLSISLQVRHLSPNSRTVIRSSDDDFAEKVQSVMRVDAALSAARIAAPHFVGAAILDRTLMCFVSGQQFIALREENGQLQVSVRPIAEGLG